MKFGQFMYYYKIKFFIKELYKKYGPDTSSIQTLFDVQRILCKKESDDV